MIPAIAYLLFSSSYGAAIGLAIWAMCMLIIVDNFLAPYLMSRGNSLHPFIVLLSVIGGISLFGPLGFIIGPVLVSLFLVLLEIYGQYLNDEATTPLRKRRNT
jgi:predicted PurR-regulated permease PerM